MKTKSNKTILAPKWLTDELQQKVRKLYEPKYNRSLSELEVVSIAENLTSFMEHFYKFKWRLEYTNESK